MQICLIEVTSDPSIIKKRVKAKIDLPRRWTAWVHLLALYSYTSLPNSSTVRYNHFIFNERELISGSKRFSAYFPGEVPSTRTLIAFTNLSNFVYENDFNVLNVLQTFLSPGNIFCLTDIWRSYSRPTDIFSFEYRQVIKGIL
jgi:hypothetical protein